MCLSKYVLARHHFSFRFMAFVCYFSYVCVLVRVYAGKTTAAHLVAKECGFRPIEFNASDTRSKSMSHARAYLHNHTHTHATHTLTHIHQLAPKVCSRTHIPELFLPPIIESITEHVASMCGMTSLHTYYSNLKHTSGDEAERVVKKKREEDDVTRRAVLIMDEVCISISHSYVYVRVFFCFFCRLYVCENNFTLICARCFACSLYMHLCYTSGKAKHLLIMLTHCFYISYQVDGMSGGDRGGMKELIGLIKNTKVHARADTHALRTHTHTHTHFCTDIHSFLIIERS